MKKEICLRCSSVLSLKFAQSMRLTVADSAVPEGPNVYSTWTQKINIWPLCGQGCLTICCANFRDSTLVRNLSFGNTDPRTNRMFPDPFQSAQCQRQRIASITTGNGRGPIIPRCFDEGPNLGE